MIPRDARQSGKNLSMQSRGAYGTEAALSDCAAQILGLQEVWHQSCVPVHLLPHQRMADGICHLHSKTSFRGYRLPGTRQVSVVCMAHMHIGTNAALYTLSGGPILSLWFSTTTNATSDVCTREWTAPDFSPRSSWIVLHAFEDAAHIHVASFSTLATTAHAATKTSLMTGR
jgi:hypothetical protein